MEPAGDGFYHEHDGTLTIESAVYQTVGAASVAWENLSGAGVFDSEYAKTTAERLLDLLVSHGVNVKASFSEAGR